MDKSAFPAALHEEAAMADAVRVLAMDSVEHAQSGHPGMPMGMADAATVLFHRFIKLDPSRPNWPDRDRFVLSAGHGSMLQYALHHLIGYADMPMEALRRFRRLGSTTPGHPEFGHTQGVETTTGPLGQGLATAVGMALAERMLAARFGEDLVDHYTYVIAGDGCLQEGLSQEAIDLAGRLGLDRLIVLWDDNGITIDGPLGISTATDQIRRFQSAGWNAVRVDGHDREAVAWAIAEAREARGPSLVACRTIIGKGAPKLQGDPKVHGAPLGADEIAAARAELGWSHPAFEIPETVYAAGRSCASRGAAARAAWEARLARSPRRAAFEAALKGEIRLGLGGALAAFRAEHIRRGTSVATRKASQMVLEVINAETELTVGGSADLTHSNLTLTTKLAPVRPGAFEGRYIHYGVREHGMAAAMNGLALHGGLIPYGGTFLCFADYARGAIRLSAIMGLRVIYVLTHDSIGLGEDGPTHQPVEHLAMLRATPNLNVFRPADVVETAECWELALEHRDRPSALVLARQTTPLIRRSADRNECARGGYVVLEPDQMRDVTLIATGSEVAVALAAAKTLAAQHGVAAAVVSLPCWELFEAQDGVYRREVLGFAPRIAVEAGARMGWDRWIGETGGFVGMRCFGASAPADELYEHFEITPDAVVAMALDRAVRHGKD